jgi:hypothetical protein
VLVNLIMGPNGNRYKKGRVHMRERRGKEEKVASWLTVEVRHNINEWVKNNRLCHHEAPDFPFFFSSGFLFCDCNHKELLRWIES